MKKKIWTKKLSLKLILIAGAVMMTALLSQKKVEAAGDALYVQATSVQSTYRQSGSYSYPTPSDGYIFAGWYADDAGETPLSDGFTNDTAYAKYVPEDVLGVKAQVTSNAAFGASSTVSMRFITSVDTLNYDEVGFDFVIFNSSTTRAGRTSTQVYRSLAIVDDSGRVCNYTPSSVFDNASKYFMAYTFTGIANKHFGHGIIAKPYWVTMDGTKVYGVEDTKTVNMAYMSKITDMSTSTVSGKMNEPTSAFGTTTTYVTTQGACTDGTYFYQAYRYNCQTSDYTDDVALVRKFTINSSGWSHKANSAIFPLHHANDITYNSKLGVLVIVHGIGNKTGISFMNPDTLEIVNPTSLGFASCDDYTVTYETYNGTKYYYISLISVLRDGDEGIWSMEYNALHDRYVVGRSGRQAMYVLDSNFGYLSSIGSSETTYSFTTQSIAADDTYIYSVLFNGTYYGDTGGNLADFDGHLVAVYTWDGSFVSNIDLGMDITYEPEAITLYNNTIYISYADHDAQCAYAAKVSGVTLASKTTVATVAQPDGTTENYASLEAALFNAQEGSTVTILDDVTVTSVSGIACDNVTVTNKKGVDVTVYRGFGGAIISNDSEGLTIKANTTGSLTFDGNAKKGGSLFKNSSDASMTVDGVTVLEALGTNTSTINGGVFYNWGDLTVTDCTFNYCTATGRASILYSEEGSTSLIEGSTFTGNSSTAGSGGVMYVMGKVTVKDSSFIENTAVNNGGVINCVGGTLIVEDSYFESNSCESENGGAVAVSGGGSATLEGTGENAIFTYNMALASKGGGAIYNNNASISVTGYTFNTNMGATGGAIYIGSDGSNDLLLEDCKFIGNMATSGNGGAIYHNKRTLTITDCTFGEEGYGNSATLGGAIYNANSGTVVLVGNDDTALFAYNEATDSGGAVAIGSGRLEADGYTFDGNSAAHGGAIQFNSNAASSCLLENSTFINNTVTGNGGAIRINISVTTSNVFYIDGCTFGTSSEDGNSSSADAGGALYVNTTATTVVTNSSFAGNTSVKSGGAVFSKGPLTFTGSKFNSNQSGTSGGAINNDGGTLTVSTTSFSSNYAPTYGGAIYNGSSGTVNINGTNKTTETFTSNSAGDQGGAIRIGSGTVNVKGYSFSGNTATNAGNAIRNSGGTLNIYSSCVFGSSDNVSHGSGTTNNPAS